ncbi:hypothetical protein [Gracilimonas tropica]|uniref:hypothetical protein n=1 Tax=Gracilimonas tropica TaxID=454600 RepID=UPI00036CC1CF|nr:hypothetical protein [Gracilimonas tropica]
MDKISQKDIDWLLNLKGSTTAKNSFAPPPKKRRYWLQISAALFILFGMVILPFFLLIRTSVFLNLAKGWNAWLSLGGGIFATVLLLVFYLFLFFRKYPNKKLLLKLSLSGAGILVFSFCLYGVMYLSSVNAKSEDIRNVYRSMHPVLRVAVATTTLADGDLVITDIRRAPEDYERMGLPLNERSLHYPQAETGYVHAVDLRTKNRSEIRNILLQYSLEAMGFYTLRHTGTGDHLHISFPRSN